MNKQCAGRDIHPGGDIRDCGIGYGKKQDITAVGNGKVFSMPGPCQCSQFPGTVTAF